MPANEEVNEDVDEDNDDDEWMMNDEGGWRSWDERVDGFDVECSGLAAFTQKGNFVMVSKQR